MTLAQKGMLETHSLGHTSKERPLIELSSAVRAN